jgi:hypothetical protein
MLDAQDARGACLLGGMLLIGIPVIASVQQRGTPTLFRGRDPGRYSVFRFSARSF